MLTAKTSAPAWTPKPGTIAKTRQSDFLRFAQLRDHAQLAQRAAADPGWLWDAVIRFAGLRFFTPYDKIMDDSQGMEWTKWCVGGTTNHVLNCIDRHRGTACAQLTYMYWEGEDGAQRELSWRQFDEQVCLTAAALRKLGVGKGDTVALFMPALPETFIAYFGVLKLGAVVVPLFSGFGAPALAERIGIAEAKVVVTADGTWRRGKRIALKETLDEALERTPSVEHVLVVRRMGDATPMDASRDHWWHAQLDASAPLDDTEPMSCNAPAVVHFTSGTTGTPKGCVYTHIGLAAKMAFDHGILTDFGAGDCHLCMADMGWMVGSKSATIPALHGARTVVAEGVPDYPQPGRIWRLIERYKVSWIELSPAVVRAQMRHPQQETKRYDVSSLRIVLTGGEAWQERPWRWLFDLNDGRVPILDSAGGTEVSGSILLCDLHHPLRIGEFSIAIPGMHADVVDAAGAPAAPGEMGELVMRGASIGLTAGLFKQPQRYKSSYWSKYPGLWAHGDLCSRSSDGYWRLHGRADDTIKVAGKRIGPTEIENAAMRTGEIAECAAVGLQGADGAGELVLALAPLAMPAAGLANRVCAAIGKELGKSFAPHRVIVVDGLPKTRSQKIMRRSVRAALAGTDAGDTSMLVNPEALESLRAAAHVAEEG